MTAATDQTIELGRPGATLRGVAGDGHATFAAIATGASSVIQGAAWQTSLDGVAGPIAYASGRVIASLGGSDRVANIAMRGQPGAVLAALDAATGKVQWQVAVDASEWAVIAAVAATPDGIAVAGTFQGTLRVGAAVVASAGRSDGFVARISLDGQLAWLVRVGGEGADGLAGVALAQDRVAIAGTVAAGAELLGQPLPAVDERSLLADAFVAELDRDGHRAWAKTFGGAADDHVAGVAIDGRGRVVVAAIARETVRIDGVELAARGPADGLVAWFSPAGVPGAAMLLGGGELDGLRAICAAGDRAIVGGFFTGTLQLGDRVLTATGGGEDAFLAELDEGKVVASWPIGGDGREEIVALSAIPGGFAAGIAHTTAATVGAAEPATTATMTRGGAGTTLPSPQDPLAGFAVITRGVAR